MGEERLVLNDYHVAVVGIDRMEAAGLNEPIRILKQAGAQVDVLPREEFSNETEHFSPDAYDAVLVPGTVDTDNIRLEAPAQEFVRAMRQAGKPVFCVPGHLSPPAPPPVAVVGAHVNTHTIWPL